MCNLKKQILGEIKNMRKSTEILKKNAKSENEKLMLEYINVLEERVDKIEGQKPINITNSKVRINTTDPRLNKFIENFQNRYGYGGVKYEELSEKVSTGGFKLDRKGRKTQTM